MTGLALLLAVAAFAAAPSKPAKASKPAVKADPCADPGSILPALTARAMEDGEDKLSGPPQTKVLGREAPLKRLVFDGEPSYLFDVVTNLLPDGDAEAASLLIARVERVPGALHREFFSASLKGELRGGAVFSDQLGEDGRPTEAPTLQNPLSKGDPSARAAFKETLKGLCREAQQHSAQERLLALPPPRPR